MMNKRRWQHVSLWIAGAAVTLGATVRAERPASPAEAAIVRRDVPTRTAPPGADVIRASELAATDLVPLPPDVSVTRHRYVPGEGATVTQAGDLEGAIVYSNTRGTFLFPPGADRLIADDIFTTAFGGCELSAYRILVGGGGDGTGNNPFTVDFALYDGCPGDGASPIPGTEGSMTFDDDGLHEVTIDLAGEGVMISPSLWIGTSYSRAGAGWISGMMADIGFTDDVYHFPTFPCSAVIGFGIYAGFYTEIACTDNVATQFVAYLNAGSGMTTSQGANATVLDDVELIVDECAVTGYEVALRGTAGPYEADLELWGDCDAGSAIPGTAFTFEGLGNGTVELASVVFDKPIPLDANIFWVAITPNRGSTGPIVAGDPVLGASQDLFAVWNQPDNPGGCNFFFFGGDPLAAFRITVFCDGTPATGACCELQPPPFDATCVVTPEFSCDGRWIEGAACDDAPFDPPCGASACCLPGEQCENLTRQACLDAGGVWNSGIFCDDPDLACPFFACIDGFGDCCGARDLEPGCANRTCCEAVCSEDPWCCQVEWDEFCVDEALAACNLGCPFTDIEWLDPPSPIVDARQPTTLGDAAVAQGLDRFVIAAGPGAVQSCCWDVCDTSGATNAVHHVEDHGDGTMTLVLDRPITPGAVTILSYPSTTTQPGRFTYHPANVDGDGFAGPSDILAMIDCCFQGDCVGKPWQCDTDRSGEVGPADLLRVIDLLNGAANFDPWLDTPLPDAAPCQ